MASIDPSSLLTTKHGQLAPLLIGKDSLFAPRYWDRTGLHVIDESSTYQPVSNQVPTFGGQVRFILPKRATMLGVPLLETVLSGATLGAGQLGAYINNVGDALVRRVEMLYGNHVLQSYPGEFQQIYRRVCKHEVFEEGRDELTLGNRRYGPAGDEATRQLAFVNGLTLYSPLDELWFTHFFDEYWMPEAYATEAEIVLQLEVLGNLAYTNVVAPAVIPDAPSNTGGVDPAITSMVMRIREVTMTAPEKASRLQFFNSDKGLLTHMLDVEQQARNQIVGRGGAGNSEYRIRLDNIRLDMAVLYFTIRKADGLAGPTTFPSVNIPWSADRLDSDNADPAVLSVVTGNDVGAMLPCVSFRLEANGSRITNDIPDLINRAFQRQLFFKEAQTRDFVYFFSFAAAPDNRKHVTGFLNAANLGNLELVITMANWTLNEVREVDVWAHSHNIIQSRRGDAVKALK